ncbi:MAG: metallophosphoesterase family protein [Verrucomicrobiota bacterium]
MKILLVADFHYTLKQYDWLCEVAGRFDVVVFAGDFLDIVSIVEMDVQILVVMKYLRRLAPKTQMLVSSGNHDLNADSDAGERCARWMGRVREMGIPADGESWEKEGILFTICPWWDGEVKKAEVAAQLEGDAAKEKERWFWVYHAPPVETKVSWDGKRDFGDASLRQWIGEYQPELVLSGHIHQAPFAKGGSWVDRVGETWVFNSGKQIGPIPAFTVIDTEGQRAEWVSLAGREWVNLATGEMGE